jgi:hypothetical protein
MMVVADYGALAAHVHDALVDAAQSGWLVV